MDARMFGNRDMCGADQHQMHAVDERCAVVLEEVEQLDATLVLVDASDVDREAVANIELLPEAAAVRTLRDLRANADDDAGDGVVLRDEIGRASCRERV